MANFAKLDGNNVVTFVTVGRQEDDGLEAELTARTGDVYKQTSYNTLGGVHYTDGEPSADQTQALRFNYAGIGYSYDETRDAFIPPQPYASWVLDEATCWWVAPIPMPTDGADYVWDEQATEWIEVTNETV
jgi:hypothetical protein